MSTYGNLDKEQHGEGRNRKDAFFQRLERERENYAEGPCWLQDVSGKPMDKAKFWEFVHKQVGIDIPETEFEARLWANEQLEIINSGVMTLKLKEARKTTKQTLTFMIWLDLVPPEYMVDWLGRLNLVAMGPAVLPLLTYAGHYVFANEDIDAFGDLHEIVAGLVGVPKFTKAEGYNNAFGCIARVMKRDMS